MVLLIILSVLLVPFLVIFCKGVVQGFRQAGNKPMQHEFTQECPNQHKRQRFKVIWPEDDEYPDLDFDLHVTEGQIK